MSNYRFRETRYGFDYGPLKVQRVATDPKAGVIIHVGSEHKQFQVRVSPKGQKVEVREVEDVRWYPTPQKQTRSVRNEQASD